MLLGDFADHVLHLGKLAFGYIPIVRSDGEPFSLKERARDAGEFFPKLVFGCIQCRQKLFRLLSLQSAGSSDIKPMAASINDCVDTNALPNVSELPAAQDSHGYFRCERAQDCTSGLCQHRLGGPTDDRRERTVVIQENRKAAFARTSDFFNMLECRGKH